MTAATAPAPVSETIPPEVRADKVRRPVTSRLLGIWAVLVYIWLFAPIFVIVLFSFNDPVGKFNTSWNEFTLAVVVMTDPGSKTLPVWLVAFTDARSRGVDWGAIMASSTLITIPVIVFFLLVQRRMVTGLTAGAVKG